MAYDVATLEADIEHLRRYTDAVDYSRPVMRKAAAMLDNNDAVLEQLDAIARQVRDLQRILSAHMDDQDDTNTAMLKAIQILLKERKQTSRPAAALSALGKAVPPEKVRALGEQVVRLFGAKGGTPMKYDKNLAYRLLQKGLLTNSQHSVWKKTHRLPDGVDVRQGAAQSVLQSRPA